MLFKDSITKENLLKYYVRHETNTLYIQGIEELKSKKYSILGIVCDGWKDLTQSFEVIPVRMCQFHQAVKIRRYLTKKPKLKVAQKLMKIVDLMTKTDKDSFTGALELWFDKWKNLLNERTVNPLTWKSFYTHKRLKNAYRSLKNNLQWLFTWYDYINPNIPNTTNAIDGLLKA